MLLRLWLLLGSDRQCQLLSCPGQLKRLMALAMTSFVLQLRTWFKVITRAYIWYPIFFSNRLCLLWDEFCITISHLIQSFNTCLYLVSDHEVRLWSTHPPRTLSSEIESCTSNRHTPSNPYTLWRKLMSIAIKKWQRNTKTKTKKITNMNNSQNVAKM